MVRSFRVGGGLRSKEMSHCIVGSSPGSECRSSRQITELDVISADPIFSTMSENPPKCFPIFQMRQLPRYWGIFESRRDVEDVHGGGGAERVT